jgi:hypothetical protein
MKFIQGKPRNQWEMYCLDAHVDADNEVRLIERSEHMDLIEANKARLQENLDLYRRRQAIVEHPFGVIKRQWDFYYIMTKRSIKHASSDVGMIFMAYNLRRIFNILDKNLLKAYLKGLGLYFWPFQRPFKAIFRHSGFLGWESEFFVRLFFGMLKCQKMV